MWKYVENNKAADIDWFRLESNREGTRWFGKCWYIHELLKYEFDVEFDVSSLHLSCFQLSFEFNANKLITDNIYAYCICIDNVPICYQRIWWIPHTHFPAWNYCYLCISMYCEWPFSTEIFCIWTENAFIPVVERIVVVKSVSHTWGNNWAIWDPASLLSEWSLFVIIKFTVNVYYAYVVSAVLLCHNFQLL